MGEATRRIRNERLATPTTLGDVLKASEIAVVMLLIRDGVQPEPGGAACPSRKDSPRKLASEKLAARQGIRTLAAQYFLYARGGRYAASEASIRPVLRRPWIFLAFRAPSDRA